MPACISKAHGSQIHNFYTALRFELISPVGCKTVLCRSKTQESQAQSSLFQTDRKMTSSKEAPQNSKITIPNHSCSIPEELLYQMKGSHSIVSTLSFHQLSISPEHHGKRSCLLCIKASEKFPLMADFKLTG